MAKYAAAKLLAILNSPRYDKICDEYKCTHSVCQEWEAGMIEYRKIAHANPCQCEDCRR